LEPCYAEGKEATEMLIDKHSPENVFARVPELAAQIDPVLHTLDVLLEDDQLYQQVRTDLGKRYRYTLVHGRHSTPVEVILRLLICKHLYAWSFKETEKRVGDSLVLRWFCRVYFERVPDETTVLRWLRVLRPETLHAPGDRVIQLAVQAKVTSGRKLRLDATCVQTEIHHPTDSGLLVDSVRVLSRFVKGAKEFVKEQVSYLEQTRSFTGAHGEKDGTNAASAVAAQRRRQRSRAETALSEAG
jgi:transposase, IS5 family